MKEGGGRAGRDRPSGALRPDPPRLRRRAPSPRARHRTGSAGRRRPAGASRRTPVIFVHRGPSTATALWWPLRSISRRTRVAI